MTRAARRLAAALLLACIALGGPHAAAQVPEVETKAPAPAPTLPTSLKIGDGEVRLGSLLQAWYVADDSPVSTATTTFLGNTTGENTFRLRRAEIRLVGTIVPGWGFEMMADTAKATSSAAGQDGKILQDLLISYSKLKGHEIAIGQKKTALMEESLHSSADLDFVERAQVTRNFADRRETGLFYRGDWSPLVTTWVSITNGTPTNVTDDSNDTVFWAGRVDYKPIKGLIVGGSGGYSGGEGREHLTRTRVGAHVRYDRTPALPFDFRFEYMVAKDGQASGSDLRRSGWFATAMYTFRDHYQLAVRCDELDRNRDVDGSKTKTFTGGLHYLVKGRSMNLKLDWYHVKEEGRRIDNVLEETYNQAVLAAQISF